MSAATWIVDPACTRCGGRGCERHAERGDDPETVQCLECLEAEDQRLSAAVHPGEEDGCECSLCRERTALWAAQRKWWRR